MIYFDNSATTRPCKAATDAFLHTAREVYGNPSSVHFAGLLASKALKAARSGVAAVLGENPETVTFPSSGTMADNIAILGGSDPHRGKHLLTTSIEHPAVLQTFKSLEAKGFNVTYLDPRPDGIVHIEDIEKALTAETSLVSIMHVNNETGAVMPIEKVKSVIRNICPDALFHSDAVQSFGKIPIYPSKWGIDLLSASAHKIHALKGAALLYIRPGLKLKPIYYGGGQENNIAPGTENLPAICAFAAACGELNPEKPGIVRTLSRRFKEGLRKIDGAVINSPDNAIDNIINVSFGKIPSEIVANTLSNEKICISKGSACSASKAGKSYVLRAMKAENPDSAVRFSLSYTNTEEEIDTVLSVLYDKIPMLRMVTERM